jgi:hypothetical protein
VYRYVQFLNKKNTNESAAKEEDGLMESGFPTLPYAPITTEEEANEFVYEHTKKYFL